MQAFFPSKNATDSRCIISELLIWLCCLPISVSGKVERLSPILGHHANKEFVNHGSPISGPGQILSRLSSAHHQGPFLPPTPPFTPGPALIVFNHQENHNHSLISLLKKPEAAAAAAKSLQSCPTLCDPIDSSPPGSSGPGILQARTLVWIAISFSNAWKWKVKVKPLSRVWLFATPWTVAYQAPPSMGFSRQEYWSGVPLPSPRNQMTNA